MEDRICFQVELDGIMKGENVVPIPKTENLDHMKEIIGSLGWKLSEQDKNRLVSEL